MLPQEPNPKLIPATPPTTERRGVKIVDEREVDGVTGSALDETGRFHSDVNPDLIKKIVVAAKKKNIDPYTALAIAHQETRLGEADYGEFSDNPFHVDLGQYKGIPSDQIIENSMDILNEKFKIAKSKGKVDEADVIQAWNGYGKISPKSEYKSNMYYGIDVSKTPLDMNKNPVYGKRVLDLRDNILKKNPEIQKLVKDAYGGEPMRVTRQQFDEAKKKIGFHNDDDFVKWFMDKKGKIVAFY